MICSLTGQLSLQGDVADLSLYFSVSDNEFGQAGQTDLIPGGRDVPVTASNVVRYIHLMANHRLNTQIHAQSMAFLRGFQVRRCKMIVLMRLHGAAT